MLPLLKIDRDAVKKAIHEGDGPTGHHEMGVAPDGSDYRIHWVGNTDQWDNCPDDWLHIPIPALFADGHGEESDLAWDLFRDAWMSNEIKERLEADEYKSVVDLAEELLPEQWAEYIDTQLDWHIDAFLAACNGDGSDLKDPAPWGYTYDEVGRPVEIDPPAEFEWKA